jgi:hypothetical protein
MSGDVIFGAGRVAGAMLAKYLVEKAKESGGQKVHEPTKDELAAEIFRLRDLIEQAVEDESLEDLEDEVESWYDEDDEEDED